MCGMKIGIYRMRKENVLVAVLVVILLGGIFGYRSMVSNKTPPAVPSVALAQPAASGKAMPDSAEHIVWKDYTPGMSLAEKENKSIFLYFHAPWCTYCTKLKKTTFKDKKVLAYLNKNFVSIQVNTDENQALSEEWKVRGLPTMWFLEPDGKKINRMPGYIEAGQLLKILEYIHTQSYTTMEFREFMKQG